MYQRGMKSVKAQYDTIHQYLNEMEFLYRRLIVTIDRATINPVIKIPTDQPSIVVSVDAGTVLMTIGKLY